MAAETDSTQIPPVLEWSRRDIERRLAFRGGRHTRVNDFLSFLLGLVLAVGFYATLLPFPEHYFAAMFTERGPVPYFIVFFFCWSLAILFVKWRKLALQSKALQHSIVPNDHDFVLSAATVDTVVRNIYSIVDEPRQFVLFNRITIALSNLRNIGRVADVDEILRAQAESDSDAMETSYGLLNGFVWAIPVFGFIGTVLGLSAAIGQFGGVLGDVQDISQLTDSLRGVTSGLSIAFETTLEGLVAALVIQLGITFLKKREEEFLDACSEYCVRNVVSRLRVMPFDQGVAS